MYRRSRGQCAGGCGSSPGQFAGVHIVGVQGVCRRLWARGRSCLLQIELFTLLVLSVCRVCADTCALWAVVAASTAYTSFFFCLPSRAQRFWAPSSIALLLSWFSTFVRTASAMASAPSISTFSYMLCVMWHFHVESASGRLTFRSIAVQLDNSHYSGR